MLLVLAILCSFLFHQTDDDVLRLVFGLGIVIFIAAHWIVRAIEENS